LKRRCKALFWKKYFEVLEKGVSLPAPNEPVKENEKVLFKRVEGFEKAILT